ncbi:MAG: four helix bundle protein [Bacilli bacterium]|nr:four helix bundle protein [Bacilli bacterium]
MNKEFYIAVSVKKFIFSLDELVVNIPNKERHIKEQLFERSNELLEFLYLANMYKGKEMETYQKIVLTQVSMLDFYLEYLHNKKYISNKQCENKCNYLLEIKKMIYKWIKNNE